MYQHLIIAGICITLASLSAVVFSWKVIGDWVEPRLRYLIALAAGVFLVIIIHILVEEYDQEQWMLFVGAYLVGITAIGGATKLIPDTHHHHGSHPDHQHGKIDARRVLLGDAVHNIHDGIALVPAFLVSTTVGIATTCAIMLHEIVQEISQYFILREAGYTPKQALVRNLAAQLTLWIGIILSLLVSTHTTFTMPLIAFAAGGFSYILVRDLAPSIIHQARTDQAYGTYAALFLTGVALMTLVTLIASEELTDDVYPLPADFFLVTTTPAATA